MLFTIGTPRLMKGPLVWFKWVTRIGPILLYDKREINALKNLQKFMDEETGYQVASPLKREILTGVQENPRHEAAEFGVWIMGFTHGLDTREIGLWYG